MTTLRDIQTKALPNTTGPDYIDNGDDAMPRYTVAPEHAAMNALLTEATQYCAMLLASSITYTSDSTIDSHQAMPDFLNDMITIIYGHDQTMSLNDAITLWLDDSECFINFYMIVHANVSSYADLTTPALFDYFDFERDDLDF